MPAGATYEPIATTTLGTAANTITLSSIPATYTDLRLVLVGASNRVATGTTAASLRFNNTGGSGYSNTTLAGDGASATSDRFTSSDQVVVNTLLMPNALEVGELSLSTVDVFSYAGSTNKTVLATGNADLNGSGSVVRSVGLWRSTSAITEINLLFTNVAYSFIAGTTVTLYGIKNA
jgi:hypothetical protein